jgi:RNA polymerase sigma-70 factor (ECF subfamily)
VEESTDASVLTTSLGEPQVFAAIYDRHAAVLFRFLVRRVGRDTADELLGETFRVAFQRRGSFDTRHPSARPWLFGIATNLLAKHRRGEARRLRALSRLGADAPEGVADRVAARVDAEMRWRRVGEAIAELPAAERDALLLHVWEGLTYDEVGAALGIPTGTVRSRLNRARQRLRELDMPGGEEPHSDRAPARGRIGP